MPEQYSADNSGINLKKLGDDLKIQALNEEFEELKSDASQRIAKYRYYLNYYHGQFGFDFAGRSEGRARHFTNWAARAVQMLSQFTLPELFDVHVPRISEIDSEHDTNQTKEIDYTSEFDRSEIIEKKLRRVLKDYNFQGKKEFKEGLRSGLILGDTIFFVPYVAEGQTFKLQNIFPGHVRIKFSGSDFTKVEHAFVIRVMSLKAIEKAYNKKVMPSAVADYDPLSLWDHQLLNGKDYAVVKIKIDESKMTTFCDYEILEEVALPGKQVPIFTAKALDDPFEPWGISYLKEIIPINREHNEATSDEADIVKIFSNPKVIIRNATQKDIDNIKKMWKKGVVASKGNLEVQPFEFKNNIFPIEQRINKIEERFHKIAGLGPAVFGLPPGSINTGPSLTVQYAPTLQMSQIIWDNWEPKILSIFSYMLETLEAQDGSPKGMKQTWKQIINGEHEVKITAPSRVPREESIHVANEVNKYVQGLQSKSRTMENLGIESPEDEMILDAYEKLNPILNPELFLKFQENKIKEQQALQAAATTPAAGAQQGGNIASQQATAEAQGLTQSAAGAQGGTTALARTQNKGGSAGAQK